MKNRWNIRMATAADAAAILDIYRPIVESTAISFELSAPDAVEMAKRIQASFVKHAWLVCTDGSRVIGYAYASDFRSRLAYRWITEVSVYIRESHQKRGVAKALYDALHAILKLQQYRQAMAVMTAPNPASQAFHERYGYKHEVLLPTMGYKFNRWYGIEIMSLQLKEVEQHMPEIIPVSNLTEASLLAVFESCLDVIQ